MWNMTMSLILRKRLITMLLESTSNIKQSVVEIYSTEKNNELQEETMKCNLCDFRDKHSQGLKSHIKKIHPEKNYNSYEQCDISF